MTQATSLKIALAQMNPVLGDLAGNAAKLEAARAEAAAKGADIVVFPELFICGYPPEDLVRKPAFAAACRAAVEALAPKLTGAPAVTTVPEPPKATPPPLDPGLGAPTPAPI